MNPDRACDDVGLGYALLVQRLRIRPDMVGDVGGARGKVVRVQKRAGIHQDQGEGDRDEKRGENVSSRISAIASENPTEGMCRRESRDFGSSDEEDDISKAFPMLSRRLVQPELTP